MKYRINATDLFHLEKTNLNDWRFNVTEEIIIVKVKYLYALYLTKKGLPTNLFHFTMLCFYLFFLQ